MASIEIRKLLLIVCVSQFLACVRNNPDRLASEKTSVVGEKRLPIADILSFIKLNKTRIKDGDLIMRADADFESETIRAMSKEDRTYSHSGIAFIEGGDVFVYNNIGGSENRSEQMLRESFDSFVSPHRKDGFGIYRYQLNESERIRIHEIVRNLFDEKQLFDKSFDLKTDDKQYCSEMIAKALKKASGSRIILPTTRIYNFKLRDPKYKGQVLKEFEYYALDNLYLNTFCSPIVRISYNE